MSESLIWLTNKRKGLSAEAARRYDAAACYLIKCADGVPSSDPNYARLRKMQDEGGNFTNELNELHGLQVRGLFDYSGLDALNDTLLKYDEIIRRSGGAIKIGSGASGVTGGASVVAAGAAGCGPSAGLSCLAIPTGLGLIYLSYEEAAEGTQETFGSYRSDIGSQVLASFSAETYPGERNRVLELGFEAGTATALAKLGKLGVDLTVLDKYLPKNLSKFSDDVLLTAHMEPLQDRLNGATLRSP